MTCAICIRIDHCTSCGAELEPQDEDRCPECGDEACIITTWGETQRALYKSNRQLSSDPFAPGPDFDPAMHVCKVEDRFDTSDADPIPTDAELDAEDEP